MRLLGYISFILFLSACSLGPEKPDNQQIWDYSNPSDTGLSDSIALILNENITNLAYNNVNSLTIIKDDQLIFENYYDNSYRDRKRNLGQISMVFLITSLDLLIRDGYIQNVQEKIVNYLPEYQAIFDANPNKELITIEHLISNKSGLAWIQSNAFPDNINDLNLMKLENDWTSYVLSRPLEAEPGLRYVPNDGAGVVLARLMQNALGSDLLNYLEQELFLKIDITDINWETDQTGTLDGSAGLSMKTLDLTKFGYLLLKGGRWQRVRIISNEWVFAMTQVNIELDNSLNAGYGWWRFTDGTLNLPINDTYFAAGGIGQQLYVIPHQEMVVSIGAENYSQGFFNSSTFVFLSILGLLDINEN